HPAAAADLLHLLPAADAGGRRRLRLHRRGARPDPLQRVGAGGGRARGHQRRAAGRVGGGGRGRHAQEPGDAAGAAAAGGHGDDAGDRQPARGAAQGHRARLHHRLRRPAQHRLQDPAGGVLRLADPGGHRHRRDLRRAQHGAQLPGQLAGTAEQAQPQDHGATGRAIRRGRNGRGGRLDSTDRATGGGDFRQDAGMPAAPWPSPISTSDVARAAAHRDWPSASGGAVWWAEERPEEGGRTTIVHLAADGVRTDLLPPPWNARTRVHEYGGRPYAVAPGGEVVFSELTDQRLYVRDRSGTIRPLTPPGDRFADLTVRDGRVWCVRERHLDDGKVSRSIVSVPLTGGEAAEHVTGDGFYAYPALSPDGRSLAYVCWSHPRMPWHGTELRVTRLTGGETRTVAGGPAESVLAPRWRDDGHLYLISDRSGWWNLYLAAVRGGEPEPLCPREEEFAGPLWFLGGHPYAILADGRLAVLHGRADLRLGVLDPRTGVLTDLDTPFSGWAPALAADGASVVGIAYGPAGPSSVTRAGTSPSTTTGPFSALPSGGTAFHASAGTMPSRGRTPHPVAGPG